MKRVMMILVMVLLAVRSFAALPEHTGFVTDKVGMLTETQRTELESKLKVYEAKTGNELAVAIVSGLDGYGSVEEYANTLFHKWGIGKKDKDNGILFLWVPSVRKIRIEVGYGLEPMLPDGRAGQIIREVIAPQFQSLQYAEGVFNGVNAIMEAVAVRADPAPVPVESAPSSWGWWLYALVGMVVGFVGMSLFSRHQRKLRQAEDALAKANRQWAYTPPAPSYVPTPNVEPVQYVPEPLQAPVKKIRKPRKPRVSKAVSVPDDVVPFTIPVPVTVSEPVRRREDDSPSYSSSSWDSGSGSSGDFGGGDSGGGGASGDY